MTSQEFKNLKVGSVVTITQTGKNKGKKGTVVRIEKEGTAYLKPLDCEFEFSNYSSWRLHLKDEGLYGFSYTCINYVDRKKSDKTFYAALMFGEEVSWSTENFTEQELRIVDKFLKELNERVGGKAIDGIHIFDKDEEE